MSEVFDDIIDRETDVARIAAVVAPDFRFAYFGTAAFAVRLLRLDQKLMDGIPMNPRRMANLLNVTPELLREFLTRLSKPDDETVTLYADGPAVEMDSSALGGAQGTPDWEHAPSIGCSVRRPQLPGWGRFS